MKALALLLLISSASAATDILSMGHSFDGIIEAQGKALNEMEAKKNQFLPGGFRLTEMLTDIAVTKSGLMGISALKANNGVEIKWKRATSGFVEENEEIDLELEEENIDQVSESVITLVGASGRIKITEHLRENVYKAVTEVHQRVQEIKVTSSKNWRLRGMRLDLNFSTSGEVSYLTKAGVALRLRLDWKLKDIPMIDTKDMLSSEESRLVSKLLWELNEMNERVHIKSYTPKKVNLGVGIAHKGNALGLWKYSAGFVGYLSFVPVNKSSLLAVEISEDLKSQDFEIGGFEEEMKGSNWWPWRKRKISRVSFGQGVEKSFKTAAFFADRSDRIQGSWQVAEIKTISDISKTGFFGLADVTSKGVFEIEFKRNKQ